MGFVERDFGRATDFSKDSGVFQNCTLVLNESNTVALVELLMELRNKKSTLWIDWGDVFKVCPNTHLRVASASLVWAILVEMCTRFQHSKKNCIYHRSAASEIASSKSTLVVD